MKLPMRLFLSVLLVAGVMAAPSLRAQDLPSAPSSTSKAPAAPTPAAPRPATQTAPAPQPVTMSQPPQPAPSSAAAAAPIDEEPADTGTIIKKRVDEVNVIFTVTDKGGKFIKGLK